MDYIHRVSNYDYDERVGAFWDGYKVEFLKNESEWISKVKDINIISENTNNIVIQYEPTKSDWEDLFN